jgi:hypothetical protein
MNDDLAELKRRLVEATRRFEQASSIEEKACSDPTFKIWSGKSRSLRMALPSSPEF